MSTRQEMDTPVTMKLQKHSQLNPMTFEDAFSAFLVYQWAENRGYMKETFNVSDFNLDFTAFVAQKEYAICSSMKIEYGKLQQAIASTESKDFQICLEAYSSELRRQKEVHTEQASENIERLRSMSEADLFQDYVEQRTTGLSVKACQAYDELHGILHEIYIVNAQTTPNLPPNQALTGAMVTFLLLFQHEFIDHIHKPDYDRAKNTYAASKATYKKLKNKAEDLLNILHSDSMISKEDVGLISTVLLSHFNDVDNFVAEGKDVYANQGRPSKDKLRIQTAGIYGSVQKILRIGSKKSRSPVNSYEITSELLNALAGVKRIELKMLKRNITLPDFSTKFVEESVTFTNKQRN